MDCLQCKHSSLVRASVGLLELEFCVEFSADRKTSRIVSPLELELRVECIEDRATPGATHTS